MIKFLLKILAGSCLLLLPASALAFEYIRTPDGLTPENPITFTALANTPDEDFFADCWDGRYQVVVFEGSEINWGGAGYYFPIRMVSSATTSPFDLEEAASLNIGTTYGGVAIWFYTDTDTDTPSCDLNILEYGEFTPTVPTPPAPFQNITISGYVWNDSDKDGAYAASEAMLSGWTIFIDQNGNELLDVNETATQTGGGGTYAFSDLSNCTYKICEAMQSGLAQTYPESPFCHEITAGSGVDATGINFGNTGNHPGGIGFWKNWRSHKTYSESEIDEWLFEINDESKWLTTEFDYPQNTLGMDGIFYDATRNCPKLEKLECARRKFLAEYLAARLNEKSGRKPLSTYYSVDPVSQAILPTLTNPDSLENIFSAVESLPYTLTRDKFLTLAAFFNYINELGD